MNNFKPFYEKTQELLRKELSNDIKCLDCFTKLKTDIYDIFGKNSVENDHRLIRLLALIEFGMLKNGDVVKETVNTYINDINKLLDSKHIDSSMFHRIEEYVQDYNVIFIYLNNKGDDCCMRLIEKLEELNQYYYCVAKEGVQRQFDNKIRELSNRKFTININSIYDTFVYGLDILHNKWNKNIYEEYNTKIDDLNDKIINKVKEMNSKFELKYDMYIDKITTLCQELSSSTNMTELFEELIYHNTFKYWEKPFFEQYDFEKSMYERHKFKDGYKKENAMNIINFIVYCVSASSDYYSYKMSFNPENHDPIFIHVVEDNYIDYDLNMYFSNLKINDDKVNLILPKNILNIEALKTFYDNFITFMTEYINVKPISLTMRQAECYSDDHKLATLEISDEYCIMSNLKLNYRESDVVGRMIISNNKYIRSILESICNEINYDHGFIDDYLLIVPYREAKRSNAFDTKICDYQINSNNFIHKIIMERYVVNVMDTKYLKPNILLRKLTS